MEGETGGEEIPFTTPPEAASGMMSEAMVIAIIAGLVMLVVLALAYYFYHHTSASSGSILDHIAGQQYDVKLPEYSETYEEDKEACQGDVEKTKRLLMRRCVADVPVLLWMQNEQRNVQRLYKGSMIGKDTYESFQASMELVQEEEEQVKQEAEALRDDWGEKIWHEAVHLFGLIQKKQQRKAAIAEEQKKKKAAEKKAKADEKKKEKKKKEEEERKLIEAKKAEEELLREAEQEAEKNAGLKNRKKNTKGKKKS